MSKRRNVNEESERPNKKIRDESHELTLPFDRYGLPRDLELKVFDDCNYGTQLILSCTTRYWRALWNKIEIGSRKRVINAICLYAATHKYMELLDWLYANGARYDHEAMCVLAAETGNKEALEWVVGKKLNVHYKAARLAIKSGHCDIFRFIVTKNEEAKKKGLVPSRCRWYQRKEVCRRLIKSGDVDTFKWFLERRGRFKSKDGSPRAWCLLAAMTGKVEFLEYLYGAGLIGIEKSEKEKESFYKVIASFALNENHLSILKWIDGKPEGSKFNWHNLCRSASAVMTATREGHAETLAFFISKGLVSEDQKIEAARMALVEVQPETFRLLVDSSIECDRLREKFLHQLDEMRTEHDKILEETKYEYECAVQFGVALQRDNPSLGLVNPNADTLMFRIDGNKEYRTLLQMYEMKSRNYDRIEEYLKSFTREGTL